MGEKQRGGEVDKALVDELLISGTAVWCRLLRPARGREERNKLLTGSCTASMVQRGTATVVRCGDNGRSMGRRSGGWQGFVETAKNRQNTPFVSATSPKFSR